MKFCVYRYDVPSEKEIVQKDDKLDIYFEILRKISSTKKEARYSSILE